MMNIEKLKQKILDLAIRGKLISQDSNDESAKELIEKIQKEKQRLIKEGKIKPSKNESYIFKGSDNSYYEKIGNETKNIDDEIPFEIPENWCWVRLNQISSIVGGGTPSTSIKEYWNEGNIIWVTPAYMSKIKSKYINDSDRKITELGLDNSSARLMPAKSIIMSSRAPIGYLAINLVPACTSQGCKSIVPFIKDMSEYLYFAIKSSITRIVEASSGTTFDEISGKDFGNILIPIPPISGQLKICDLISQVFGLVDEISQNYDNLKKYIRIVKSKILDNIFGENSSYKSYYKNKMLNDISIITMGQSPNGENILLTQRDNSLEFHQGKLAFGKMFINKSNKYAINYNKVAKKNSILICVRAPVGDINVTDRDIAIGRGLCAIKPLPNVELKYLFYYLLFMNKYFKSKSSGSTFQAITIDTLKNCKILLPEIAIQRQIINRIESFYYFTDLISS